MVLPLAGAVAPIGLLTGCKKEMPSPAKDDTAEQTGKPEEERKAIFRAWSVLPDQSDPAAAARFAKKYGLSVEQVKAIGDEGLRRGWDRPN